jgi:hypothetical protein
VHLDDVYWSERSRISFDAVVCTCAFAALVVIGTRPFGLDDPGSVWGTALVVLVVIGLTTACFAKGRVLFGVIGLFVPFVALAGLSASPAPRRPGPAPATPTTAPAVGGALRCDAPARANRPPDLRSRCRAPDEPGPGGETPS